MSLQLAAQHMASRGRGPDTQLVHMAPQEVAGLQALARAHGGSLTVNPDTGLAEAGFLKKILPMVIGAGLAATGVGAPMAALMVGGGYGLASGSLSKGLMAGLGAYGGAGIAGGLMGAGAAGAGTGLTATGGVMGANPMVAQPMTFGADALGTGVGAGSGVVVNPVPFTPSAEIAGALPNAPSLAQNLNLQAQQQAAQALTGGAPQVQTATPMADRFSQLGQGFKNLGTEAGREAFMGNAASKGVAASGVGGGMGLMKYGLAGLAPMLSQEQKQTEREEEYPEYYSFDAGYLGGPSASGNYFAPTLKQIPRRAADGGMMDSGPIEAMSARNEYETLMANGGQRFKEGGETKAVKPVEQDPYYTMSGASGDAFKYLMGERASSRPTPVAATPAIPAPVAGGLSAALQGAVSGTDTPSMFAFDPATGQLRNVGPRPDLQPRLDAASAFKNYFDTGSGGVDSGGGYSIGDQGGDAVGNTGGGPGTGAEGDAAYAHGGLSTLAMAQGGQSHLGDYSDGGRLLRGPGDGVSDSIPGVIGNKRPARLADGEFVVPARIVSELGNGSTEAGARKLYAMLDRVQKARGKTTGKNRVAVNSRAEKMLPA